MDNEPSPSVDIVRERIRQQARAFAEATVYTMNNAYLTQMQKFYVEVIYQFPLGVFAYSLLIMLAFGKPNNYLEAFLVAAFVNLCVAIAVWVEASVSLAKSVFVFTGPTYKIVTLAFAGYLAYQGNWIGTGIALFASTGLVAALAPSMWLYSGLGRGMHPKYRIAKKLFGLQFPFEGHA